MSKRFDIVKTDYQGTGMTFDEGAWFNATKAAAFFGKRVDNWLVNNKTKEYLEALYHYSTHYENQNPWNSRDFDSQNDGGIDALISPDELMKAIKRKFIKTRRGKNGGTWFHPRLAVPFARWCSPDFAVWCDIQISKILEKNHPHFDWKKTRHESSASFKVMIEAVKEEREYQGKKVKAYHFSNEAKMINWAITDEFKPLDRDALPTEELELLAKLEVRNAILISRGIPYDDRKVTLKMMADDWKADKVKQLTA